MAHVGNNDGFQMLEDFICQAIPAPAVPSARPKSQGRNQGVQALENLVAETCAKPPDATTGNTGKERRLIGEAMNGMLVVHCTRNQLDELEGEQLAEVVQQRETKTVLLNLGGVDTISASFVASVVKLHKQVSSAGGELAVCNLGPQVYQTFSLLQLDRMLSIYKTLQQALQSQ